jgi:hypothetical protein
VTGDGTVDDTLAELLDPAFVADLADCPTDELRRRRGRAEQAEEAVSYARRILQGRLDILRAELKRRGDAGDGAAGELLIGLPALLGSDDAPGDPMKARATRLRVPPGAEAYEAELDAVVGSDELDGLDEHDPDQLASLVERMTEHEHELSRRRRALFGVIDAIRDELAARYKDGRASVSELLTDG